MYCSGFLTCFKYSKGIFICQSLLLKNPNFF
nr:MAG TPA: hypothetical protein [Caudoviricetes sp.]